MTEADRREQYAEDLHNSLGVYGPRGEELARTLSPMLSNHTFVEILVAFSLVRCYLEDKTNMPRGQFEFTNDYIYDFIRTQIDFAKENAQ